MSKQVKGKVRDTDKPIKSTPHIDENTDDLEFEVIRDSETTGWNFDNLHFAYTHTGEFLKKQASHFIKHIINELGDEITKPVVPDIFNMFREAMDTDEAKNYIPVVERIKKHTPGSFDDLLKAKYSFEKSTHKTQTTYLLARISAGAGIETSRVNWEFAVQSYHEAKENAEATFKEAVYSARSEEYNKWEKKYSNVSNEILAHENHFSYAVKVSKAVEDYGNLMSKANSDLTTAYSTLMTALIKQWNGTAKSEATLISTNRKDSLALWTAIKKSYNKQFGGSRKL